jgi:parallel beta helix pectate lyase-like protein
MKTRCRLCLYLLALCLFAIPNRLHAQLTKIFVASFGNDASDGSRGSPKRNFQAAHDAVAAGGQIVVLDTAGYGQLTIGKNLAITVPPGVNGFITVTGNGNGITVTSANVGVILRGLIIEGGGQNGTGSGILGTSLTNLVMDGCTVRSFHTGIAQNTTSSSLSLNDSLFLGCFDGVVVSATGSAFGTINRCRFELNQHHALRAEDGNNGSVEVYVTDSLFVKNGNGIGSEKGTSGVDCTVRVNNTSITGNGTGVLPVNGGQILSRENNTLESNALGGNTFTGTYSAK